MTLKESFMEWILKDAPFIPTSVVKWALKNALNKKSLHRPSSLSYFSVMLRTGRMFVRINFPQTSMTLFEVKRKGAIQIAVAREKKMARAVLRMTEDPVTTNHILRKLHDLQTQY